jgi:hypothetical protein
MQLDLSHYVDFLKSAIMEGGVALGENDAEESPTE